MGVTHAGRDQPRWSLQRTVRAVNGLLEPPTALHPLLNPLPGCNNFGAYTRHGRGCKNLAKRVSGCAPSTSRLPRTIGWDERSEAQHRAPSGILVLGFARSPQPIAIHAVRHDVAAQRHSCVQRPLVQAHRQHSLVGWVEPQAIPIDCRAPASRRWVSLRSTHPTYASP